MTASRLAAVMVAFAFSACATPSGPGKAPRPSAVGKAGQAVRFEVEQITSGSKHHLFGYVGHSLTIPWNESGRYIVALRVDFYKRMPKEGEAAEIILIDTRKKYEVTVVDRTLAWNLQQGTMLYWHPRAPETQFFFNDLDPETGSVFTVLYDVRKRKRVKEYRFGTESIANGGMAPNGKYFAGINYGKISRLREIISYAGAKDHTLGGIANPDHDGLFKVDVATGEREMLASYKQIAELLKIDPAEEYPVYAHHTLWNRDSDRLAFVVRGGGGGKKKRTYKWPSTACVVRPDGSNLGVIDWDGHPEWNEGNLLTLPNKKKKNYTLYNVDTKKVTGEIGEKGMIPTPGGDKAYSPDGKWFVGSGTDKKRKRCFYPFYRFSDGALFTSPGIKTRANRSTTRIDGAPRWNRTSDAILVGGVARDGTRQMSIIRLVPGKE